MEKSFEIIPLEERYLTEAIDLVHQIFPDEAQQEINPGLAFTISLDPENPCYSEFWQKDNSDWFEYYVAVDNKAQKVIGTSGLYHAKGDAIDIVFLGWYCVSLEYQGKGIGKALLQYTVERARKLCKKKLCLYTDESENKNAQFIYDNFGFKTFKKQSRGDWVATYKELPL